MNRNTFFKKCLALVGCGALINTVKAEKLTTSTPTNLITSTSTNSIKLNRLEITDGKSTYELVVENDILYIKKVKTEEEKRAEEKRVGSFNSIIINQPNKVMFALK